MNTQTPITIFSIGHGNLPIWKLINVLKVKEIVVLVDVRSLPFSRFNPQFNKDQLKASLESEGIEYRFAGNYLGGRPEDPSCYKEGKVPEGKADFLHLVDYPAVMTKEFFQTGIQHLLKIAKKEKVVVMCSESDPAACHRHHLIGKYLISKGVSVLHIYSDGHTMKDELLPNLNPEVHAEQMSLF